MCTFESAFGCFNICTQLSFFRVCFPDSDYGYERHGESQCVPAWYNPASPQRTAALVKATLIAPGKSND